MQNMSGDFKAVARRRFGATKMRPRRNERRAGGASLCLPFAGALLSNHRRNFNECES